MQLAYRFVKKTVRNTIITVMVATIALSTLFAFLLTAIFVK